MDITYPTLTTADLVAIEGNVRAELARRKEEEERERNRDIITFDDRGLLYTFNKRTRKLTIENTSILSSYQPLIDVIMKTHRSADSIHGFATTLLGLATALRDTE